jgi:hypothetical protein
LGECSNRRNSRRRAGRQPATVKACCRPEAGGAQAGSDRGQSAGDDSGENGGAATQGRPIGIGHMLANHFARRILAPAAAGGDWKLHLYLAQATGALIHRTADLPVSNRMTNTDVHR